MSRPNFTPFPGILALVLSVAACGGEPPEGAGRGGDRGHGGPPGGPGMGVDGAGMRVAAVPVEVARVMRRGISSYIETNGTLESEDEVDLVARTAGPIVELLVEEGMEVKKDQVLARLDELESRAQLEISRVTLKETKLAFERAERLQRDRLISAEEYEQALAAYDSARAQFEANQILLGYTEIRAPFDGMIVVRYVDFAQQVSVNTPLFRISDFDPLLCPIQVPERELRKLRIGQSAHITVEAFPEERFHARVLRVSPVVDADTGTVKVTLEVEARDRLRPGMFARVFLETATRPDALVIPKSALSLESIGDVVYIADGGVAARREITLGFREGDHVEVVSGLSGNESVVVVGQDGLSDGTPIQILAGGDAPVVQAPAQGQEPPAAEGHRDHRPGFDLSRMTPEQLERAKRFMRARGMTEEQIEARINRSGAQQESGQR